jgi:hypothetical protein
MRHEIEPAGSFFISHRNHERNDTGWRWYSRWESLKYNFILLGGWTVRDLFFVYLTVPLSLSGM